MTSTTCLLISPMKKKTGNEEDTDLYDSCRYLCQLGMNQSYLGTENFN